MEIINRTTVKVSGNTYKIYDKGNPQYYKKDDGIYEDIDLTFNDSTSTIGDISLLNKNVFSVGIRKDGNPAKYLGIRPDSCQDGSKQLEFTFNKLELDGETQSVNLTNDCTVDVKNNSLSKFITANKSFNDFKCEYKIDIKGMSIENDKYTEETIVRDYGLNITNTGIDTGSNVYKKVYTDASNINLDKSNHYIDMYVGQMNNDFITKGQYSNEEEFGSSDLTNYNIVDMYPNGSAVYLKDSIVLYAKGYNFEDFENSMVDGLKRAFNMEWYDDGGYGKYFTIDNKKVGGIAIKSDNEFLAFFNTKAIPDDIKSLFIRKSFDSTSYIDTTLDEFISNINSVFNMSLEIKADTNYYKTPRDYFEIKIASESFYIRKPKLKDSDSNYINLPTYHTLKDNGDGSYTYTKFFTPEGILRDSSNIKYIDATIAASQAESTPFHKAVGAKSSARFTTGRNATTGTNILEALYQSGDLSAGDMTLKTPGQFGGTFHHFYQTHYIFDSSGVTGTVDDMSFKANMNYRTDGGSHNNIDIIALKSTISGSPHKDDWNDITGFTSGWGAGDVTEYSAEFDVGTTENSSLSLFVSADGDDYTMPLNSTAKTDLKNDDVFNICITDHDQYYGNSLDTSYGANASMSAGREQRTLFIKDKSGSQPVIYYTLGEAEEAATENATFFGTNF